MTTRSEELQKVDMLAMAILITFDFTTALNFVVGPGPDTYRATNERASVTYDGNVYTSTSIDYMPAVVELKGKIPDARILIYGQDPVMLDALENYNELAGTEVTIISVPEVFLDGRPDAAITEDEEDEFVIDEVIKTTNQLTFVLTVSRGIEKILEPALTGFTTGSFSV